MVEGLVGWLRWSERARRGATVALAVVAAIGVWSLVAARSDAVPGPGWLHHLSVLGGGGWCEDQPIACAVSKSLLTALALAVVALCGFLWWRRGAISKYRRRAKHSAEDLFDWLPQGVAPRRLLGREAIIGTLLGNLRGAGGNARPQVVRGESGSGKTSLLMELTGRLARENVLAVPVSLRNAGALVDVVGLAKVKFIDWIPDDVGGKGRADRAWRQLCHDGRVVVLADGLDEATTGSALQRDEVARRALDRVRGRNVGLIVTTRTAIWHPGIDAAVHELAPLHDSTWMPFIEDRMSSPLRDEEKDRLHRFITRAGLGGRPVYLNLMARLYDLAAPSLEKLLAADADVPAIALRMKLLDAHLEEIRKSAQNRRSPIGDRAISQVLRDLEWVAWSALRLNTLEPLRDGGVAKTLRRRRRAPVRDAIADALDAAGQLGLVYLHDEGDDVRLRFANADHQALLAARLLTTDRSLLRALLASSYTAEFGTALSFYCLRADDPKARSAAVCEALLARARPNAGTLPEDARLPSLATAAEIADMAGLGDELRTRIAEAAGEAWDDAAHPSRRAAIDSVRRLRTRASYALLWTRARDPHYELRLAAAGALMAEAGHAYGSFESRVRAAAAVARRKAVPWGSEEMHEASILAWIIPSWRSLEPSDAVTDCLDAFVEGAVRDDVHISFEASLAQGFKLDAFARPDRPIDEQARALLPKVRFWYSGVALVHAVTIRGVDGGAASDARAALGELRGDGGLHPFVDRAAELGLKAISTRAWRPYVWRDEAESIAGRGNGVDAGEPLHADAARLLADIVVTLNLTERDSWKGREVEIHRHYTRRELPYCLSGSPHRRELRTGECPCEFKLCPYPPPWGTGARGDFSAAFCREQRELATARASLRRRSLVPWQRPLRRKELAAFWEWMEHRAQI